jgi:hypothetical protein
VRDLLGVDATAVTHFLEDQSDVALGGFDNVAEVLHVSPARYQQYFDAAKAVADAAWANAALRARVFTCVDDGKGQCARSIIATLGLRAWRRPLSPDEVETLGAFADAARADTGDFQLAMKRVVTLMLSSLPFLYKIELDPDPNATTPHRLTGYELASRLSYLLWSTMPDDALFARAEGLADSGALTAELGRMLDDARSDAFVRSFAGQWLGVSDLPGHGVDPIAYPAWDATLQRSMVEEMYLFFGGLLDRPFDGFLSADVHYVDVRLGAHYQLASPPMGPGFARADLDYGHLGFLGLAGFLTLTSPAYRTSPSQRGDWVLTHLLCAPPQQHAGMTPTLNLTTVPTSPRKALTQSLVGAACTDCHSTFDGVGFALEHFDGVGQYRTNYSPTEAIDATGTLGPASFDGETQLAATLAKDPRVAACAVRKTLTYALGRVLDDGDAGRLASIVASWRQGTFRDLLRTIVLDDAFQMRRGEAP